MKVKDGNVPEPLWGIGRLQIGWLVFQWVWFLGFGIDWIMGGADWRPSWKPMVTCLCGSVVAATLFVWTAERMSGLGADKQGAGAN